MKKIAMLLALAGVVAVSAADSTKAVSKTPVVKVKKAKTVVVKDSTKTVKTTKTAVKK